MRILLDTQVDLRRPYTQVHFVHQLHRFLNQEILLMVNYALVNFKLDYSKCLQHLKTTDNFWVFHVIPLLHDLHWLSVDFWAQLKILVITYIAQIIVMSLIISSPHQNQQSPYVPGPLPSLPLHLLCRTAFLWRSRWP